MQRLSPTAMVLGLGLLGAALAPVLGLPEFYVHLLVLMVIFAIFAMSLDILMGYGGLPSLGHAAFFGLAAYGIGIATVKFGLSWWEGLAIGLFACTAVAAVFGLIALRTEGLYFLLITLAFGQLLWGAANRWGSFTGGFNGMPGIRRPAAWLVPTESFYYFALAVLVLLAFLMKRLVDSPFGLALRAQADNALRARALGFNVWLHRYAAFVLSSLLAGCAGAMNAFYNGFVSPRDLSIAMSAEAILMVILGGTGTLWGPLLGAVLIVALRNFLSVYFDHWLILLGLIFIVVVLYAPKGIVGWLRALGRPREVAEETMEPGLETPGVAVTGSGAARIESEASLPAGDNPTMALTVEGVGRSFHGVQAVKNATFGVGTGERVALLGPNGAGKTTLFNMIGGALPPTEGQIRLFGSRINRIPAYRRARLGIGRTFQITSLFPSLTVSDHLRLCAIGRLGLRFNMWRHAQRIAAVESIVRAELLRARLWHLRDRQVRNLSYGHQRQLEVAMAVAMQPRVLMLDEPAAGLSVSETGPIIETIARLDRSITIVLVEHDMDVVFAVADRIIVFDHGEMIAQGSPDEIRANQDVRRIYLGRGHP